MDQIYVIKVDVNGIQKFGTKSENQIGTIRELPGALAYKDLTDAARELHNNFRGIYRGDAWLEHIAIEPYYHISEDNKIVFDKRIYDALKEA